MIENWITKSEMEEICLFINQHYGLEFPHKRLELLQEAVKKRIEVCNSPTVSSYLALIQQSKEEALQLINLLTIHETYFFREPTHFEVMIMQVIPQLLKNTEGYPFLRLLSAGCSTGEEAYSMAIAVLQIPGAGIDWDFEVIGIDIDKEAINKAQTGLYGLYSFRSCPKDIWDNYFDCVSKESFKVKKNVREKVRFESLNLFEQVYPKWTQNMDIVFYRNVSIYFSKEQREEGFRRLAGLLNRDGCLFLSCTETLDHNNNLMSLVKKGQVFYYKKQAEISINSHATVIKASPPSKKECIGLDKSRQRVAPPVKRWSPQTVLNKEKVCLTNSKQQVLIKNNSDQCQQMFVAALELIKLKKYDETILLLDKIMIMDSCFSKAYTLKANILLDQQKIEPAIELCQAALVIDIFSIEAYLLLGMAAKLIGEMEMAVQRFKEAVYVEPECWLAHFFLAQVYQGREESRYAKREYEVAMRILKQGNFENHGLSFFVLPFQLDHFIQLCQHSIANLKD